MDRTLDAVFDEGIKGWGTKALQLGMRFLALEPKVVERFERLGHWGLSPLAESQA